MYNILVSHSRVTLTFPMLISYHYLHQQIQKEFSNLNHPYDLIFIDDDGDWMIVEDQSDLAKIKFYKNEISDIFIKVLSKQNRISSENNLKFHGIVDSKGKINLQNEESEEICQKCGQKKCLNGKSKKKCVVQEKRIQTNYINSIFNQLHKEQMLKFKRKKGKIQRLSPKNKTKGPKLDQIDTLINNKLNTILPQISEIVVCNIMRKKDKEKFDMMKEQLEKFLQRNPKMGKKIKKRSKVEEEI